MVEVVEPVGRIHLLGNASSNEQAIDCRIRPEFMDHCLANAEAASRCQNVVEQDDSGRCWIALATRMEAKALSQFLGVTTSLDRMPRFALSYSDQHIAHLDTLSNGAGDLHHSSVIVGCIRQFGRRNRNYGGM
ncbi:MAG: hypothetical protein ABS76_13760 [Pelagibacterium sp. SCN 64-44]|nr:MAG: hypothetical protein ABS76_13760 [Pelagibacterium sp. SCN 64-44]